MMIFIEVSHYKGSLFISSLCEIHVGTRLHTHQCVQEKSLTTFAWMLIKYCQSAACATPHIGIVRGLWEGDCLAEHGHPLARPLGMPSGHVAHASLSRDAWIHYYLVMDFTVNNSQTISNR